MAAFIKAALPLCSVLAALAVSWTGDVDDFVGVRRAANRVSEDTETWKDSAVVSAVGQIRRTPKKETSENTETKEEIDDDSEETRFYLGSSSYNGSDWQDPPLHVMGSDQLAASARSPSLKQCGASGSQCPLEDTCCVAKRQDAFNVPGGFGCAPPNSDVYVPMVRGKKSTKSLGCPQGGAFPGGCCCGPGPSLVSTTGPNVLMIGDSITAGHFGHTKKALKSVNVQLSPDNVGGARAHGVRYGALCVPYFLRTPQHVIPPWDVITFNFGLHDGRDSNSTYYNGLSAIADTILSAAHAHVLTKGRPARVIYFLTTAPGGSRSVPGEPVSPDRKRVQELNEIAVGVMSKRKIRVVDLYKSMLECGDLCKDCKPHCGKPGYQFLSDHAIVPALREALEDQQY